MPKEFQVILLCGGGGSRLYPLAATCPKSLLPVANRPLLTYQLELLERVGFQDVIIVGRKDYQNEFYHTVNQYRDGSGRIDVEWYFIDDVLSMGTAEVLLKLKDLIVTDFIVMSGDMIADERFVHEMADVHRAHNPTLTMLLAPSTSGDYVDADYIGLAEERSYGGLQRVVLLSAGLDVHASGVLHVQKSLLGLFPNFTVHTDLADAHFYIFRHGVLRLLEQHKFVSIRQQFVPYLVGLQAMRDPPLGFLGPPPFAAALSRSGAPSHLLGSKSVRCFAVSTRGYCLRVRTLAALFAANADVIGGKTTFDVSVSSVRRKDGSLVAREASCPARGTMKGSIVGAHSRVGEGSVLSKTLVMSHATVGKDVKLEGTIVADYADVADSCVLVDCVVGEKYKVPPGTNASKKKFIEGFDDDDDEDGAGAERSDGEDGSESS